MKTKLLQCALTAIILVLFSNLNLTGQVSGMAAVIPCDGYIVLLNGDTLSGRIRWAMKYVENNPVEIKFTSGNGTVTTYEAGQIRGFGNIVPNFDSPIQAGLENYVSMTSFKKGVPVFFNRLLAGRITLYLNRSSLQKSSSRVVETSNIDGLEFNWTPGEGLSIGPSYRTSYRIIEGRMSCTSYFCSKDNGPLTKIEKDNYKSYFSEIFGDCPAIDQEIEKNPKLQEFRYFSLLAEIYNQLCQVPIAAMKPGNGK